MRRNKQEKTDKKVDGKNVIWVPVPDAGEFLRLINCSLSLYKERDQLSGTVSHNRCVQTLFSHGLVPHMFVKAVEFIGLDWVMCVLTRQLLVESVWR
jgi:hypothetical protein